MMGLRGGTHQEAQLEKPRGRPQLAYSRPQVLFRHGRQFCVDLGTFCGDSAPEAHAYKWLPVYMVAPIISPFSCPIPV